MARRRGNNPVAIALAFMAGAVCMLLIVIASRLSPPEQAAAGEVAPMPPPADEGPVVGPVKPRVRPDSGHDRPAPPNSVPPAAPLISLPPTSPARQACASWRAKQ